MPRKPQKSKREAEDLYIYRLKEWEALRPHDVNAKPKGNAMTQKYYTDRLLPVYISAIEEMRHGVPEVKEWLLQEDGDPSHGMRKPGLTQELKDYYKVKNIIHPAQSPDLNPIEAY
jgi:hypothetical protein